MQLLIWLLLFFAVYPYAFYPLILKLISLLRASCVPKDLYSEENLPKATLLITAYNEEEFLEAKIQNSLKLDYPDLEIVVVSDGSTDRTNEILASFPEVKSVILPKRSGKPTALKAGLEVAGGEIICLSDVSALYEENCLKLLVAPLLSPEVGATGGVLSFRKHNAATPGEVTYSSYESKLRALETEALGTIVLPGTFYAVRRRDMVLPPEDIIADDFYVTCSLLERGLKLIQVDKAMAFEQASHDTSGEFIRKSRIIAGGMQTLARFPKLLFGKWGFFLVSHKVLRWGAALFGGMHYLLLAFSGLCPWLFAAESVLLLLGIISTFLDLAGVKTPKIMALLRHFVVVNAAVYWGIIGLLSGRQTVKWQR
jgi:cellulose synthase/poly-beta-1,6-N-acetylglucosamine synthase-like glycosyltransferase